MPDFFDKVDELGIVENHLRRLSTLEEKESYAILKTYKQVRQDLRDRLEITSGDTFTAQRLRGVLIQVEAAIEAMQTGLLEDIDEQTVKTATKGIEDLVSEVRRFSSEFEDAVIPISLDTVRVAQDARAFLINRYETSIRSYSQDVRSTITRELTMAAIEEISTPEIMRRVGQWFLGEEWKLRRIVRTELHNIYNVGKIYGMKEVKADYIPNLKKTLYHPIDSRTGEDSKYADRLKLIVEITEPFRYIWKGKERVFMSNDRPNDRSVVVPYREEWDR